jgi:hypothetical protein
MGADGTYFRSLDREDDHGEEIEGEEEIHYQEEGRSGAQEEKSREGGGEKGHQESREEGCSEAEGAGKETCPGNACHGAYACPVLAARGRVRRRREQLALFSRDWKMDKRDRAR